MADKRSKRVKAAEKATNDALGRYKKMSKKSAEPGKAGRIGFGLTPTYKANRSTKEVVLDINTTSSEDSQKDQSILYVPGWSLSE